MLPHDYALCTYDNESSLHIVEIRKQETILGGHIKLLSEVSMPHQLSSRLQNAILTNDAQ